MQIVIKPISSWLCQKYNYTVKIDFVVAPEKSNKSIRSSGSVPQEWSVIELQGELRANFQAVLEKAVLGDLHYTNQGEPLLIIGHHVLSGKVSKFERPLAIMECVNANLDNNEVKYELRGIVKRKLIFSERPRPIVASTEEEEAPQL